MCIRDRGGLFLDLISGFTQYAPFSLIAHGLEGLIAGWLAKKAGSRKVGQWCALIIAALVMVVCYFFANSLLYTWTAGVLGIGTNLLQGIIGVIITMLVVPAVKRRLNF